MATPCRAPIALALGLAALLGAVACSSSASTLDQAATESAVGNSVATDLQLEVERVTCPEDLPLAEDEAFDCEVFLAVGTEPMPVVVIQTDAVGSLQVTPRAAVIEPATAAAEAKAALKEEFGRSFLMDCGDDEAEVYEPGESFQCRARDAHSRRSVTVTVTDAAGTLRFEIGDPTN